MDIEKLKYYPEPKLTFGSNQAAEDPRDGLMLFGPNEKFSRTSIKAGVVGTSEGIQLYKDFVNKLQSPIISSKKMYGNDIQIEAQRPSFVGFEAIYGIEWDDKPILTKQLLEIQVNAILEEKNKKKRTRSLVDFYAKKIIESKQKDDKRVDIWFVIVPRNVYIKCRYGAKGEELSKKLDKKITMLNEGQFSLYPDYDEDLKELEKLKEDSSDFHNLLKAVLLKNKIESPIQVFVEPTLRFRDKLRNKEYSEDMKAHLAWTTSVAIYYKLGNKPWVLNDVRKDVCYLGLIFKQLPDKSNKQSVCSAAQMFLEDGDGSIFRGNIGLFKSERAEGYHLDEISAESLLGMALDDFQESKGYYPKELFIHGRVKFQDKEWKGFNNALEARKAETNLNGILIKDTRSDARKKLKIFKDTDREGQDNNYGIMRGLAWHIDEKSAYLFTRGYIPRTNSTNHLETANPLYVEINRGNSKIETVLKDILALTKLNYNACVYGDGLPVTLRFSDLIGNILTATSEWQSEMRQFKYYI
ncbi:hypothetical protein Q2T41_00475 [Maribacter confluentis]|uniref:Piwi domain-containing protein n=1 Tax=Maribacter confluentis TaxID=1656093 RepID=A0ABT8RJ78_9FLAO|nr:hypothetical protein [Maribacter confluentis]MDO1511135.1 hypothetical protein [Maribacter confluentis]